MTNVFVFRLHHLLLCCSESAYDKGKCSLDVTFGTGKEKGWKER